MQTRIVASLYLVVLVGAGACSDRPILGCPQPLIAGLAIEARDSVSGAQVSGARAVATTGTFADTLLLPGQAAWGRGGVYTVTIDAPGYRSWRQTGITVRADRCGLPTPVIVVARLQRAS